MSDSSMGSIDGIVGGIGGGGDASSLVVSIPSSEDITMLKPITYNISDCSLNSLHSFERPSGKLKYIISIYLSIYLSI